MDRNRTRALSDLGVAVTSHIDASGGVNVDLAFDPEVGHTHAAIATEKSRESA